VRSSRNAGLPGSVDLKRGEHMEMFLIVCSKCGVVFDPDNRPSRKDRDSFSGEELQYKCPVCAKWINRCKGRDFHYEPSTDKGTE
jgi:hypothetical protein